MNIIVDNQPVKTGNCLTLNGGLDNSLGRGGAAYADAMRHAVEASRDLLFVDWPAIGFVYFAMADVGLIKIGFTRNLRQRRKGLRAGATDKIEFAATRPGNMGLEAFYHMLFWEHRVKGEWFERHPDILAEIERLRA